MRALLIAAVIAISGGCQSAPVDYGSIRDKLTNGESVSIEHLRDAYLDLPDLAQRMERLADLEQRRLRTLPVLRP